LALRKTQRKRKRTHPARPAEDTPFACHAAISYYLEDGNIVVVAEGVAFRVHRSLLTRHSEIFSDMFDMETYDGCHVVRVPDATVHMLNLLSVLYDNP
jgi:BTB/POZ domain